MTQPDIREDTGWRPLGRYQMGPRLASGGMADLYLARATGVHGFQKYLVVKRILSRWADDREFVEMFLDEARLAAQLDHPNVVHVHDIGEDDDGPFFAMEYIHGQHVLAILRRCRDRGLAMDWGAFVALGSAAAAGLQHAHDRRGFDGRALGIIHRDVSPTNILVTYEGAVKVVDFGIAKATSSRHSTLPSTRKGKMAYMSPEQIRGDTLDRRSDLFSLGTVLYELATLGPAFRDDTEFALMNRIVNHDLEPASSRRPEVPLEIDRILARALQRNRDARYPSLRELQRDLDAFAAAAGLTATTDVLARLMEELFGSPPYPWETGSSPVEASTEHTGVAASMPATVVKSADVVPLLAASTTHGDHVSRSRSGWITLGLATIASAIAFVVWRAADDDVTPRQVAPERAAAPADATSAEPIPPPPELLPAAPAPVDPAPRVTDVPIESQTKLAPQPSSPAPKRTRRTPSPTATKPATPTAPAFDPDAPAPRPH